MCAESASAGEGFDKGSEGFGGQERGDEFCGIDGEVFRKVGGTRDYERRSASAKQAKDENQVCGWERGSCVRVRGGGWDCGSCW